MQSGFQLAFSQPLLKDRAIDEARQQYIIAKRNQESSDLRFREAVVQTVAAVKQAYWTFKAAIANVAVQQRSLELAEELARENKVRVNAGQIPPLDLVQAEAEVAQRRENLIRARTIAEDAEDALRRLIVDPSDMSFWQVRIDPTEEPTHRRAGSRRRRRCREGAQSAIRPGPGGPGTGRTRRRTSTSFRTSVCPTSAWRRHTAAAASVEPSSCEPAVFRDR